MSGFFFCGIIDEPVVYASESSTNPNSQLDHSTSSSERVLEELPLAVFREYSELFGVSIDYLVKEDIEKPTSVQDAHYVCKQYCKYCKKC